MSITWNNESTRAQLKTKFKIIQTGKKKIVEQIKEFAVVDEIEGKFTQMKPEKDYFKSEEGKGLSIEGQKDILKRTLEKANKADWFRNQSNCFLFPV